MRLALLILALWFAKPPCAVDLDRDGQVSVLDWLVYAGWYFAGDIRADWRGDGTVERGDATAYIADWMEGCP